MTSGIERTLDASVNSLLEDDLVPRSLANASLVSESNNEDKKEATEQVFDGYFLYAIMFRKECWLKKKVSDLLVDLKVNNKLTANVKIHD